MELSGAGNERTLGNQGEGEEIQDQDGGDENGYGVSTCQTFLPCFAKGSCTKTYSIANNPTLHTFMIHRQYSKYLSYNSLLPLSIIQDCLTLVPLGCGRGRVGSGVMGSLPSQAPGWLLNQPSALSAIEHHSLTHNLNHMVGRHASMHFQSSDLEPLYMQKILANDCLFVLLDTFSQGAQLNKNLDIPVTSNSKSIVNMSSENMHTGQVKGGNNGNNSKIISNSSMVNCSTCTRTASEAKGTLAISMQFQCPPAIS